MGPLSWWTTGFDLRYRPWPFGGLTVSVSESHGWLQRWEYDPLRVKQNLLKGMISRLVTFYVHVYNILSFLYVYIHIICIYVAFIIISPLIRFWVPVEDILHDFNVTGTQTSLTVCFHFLAIQGPAKKCSRPAVALRTYEKQLGRHPKDQKIGRN